MAAPLPKARSDLQYFDREVDGEDVVLVLDPVRTQYFRYNALQAAMLQALDGTRTPEDITRLLSEKFEVEIPSIAAERFISRAKELLLLDISSYDVTPPAASVLLKKSLARAGFQRRGLVSNGLPRAMSPESLLFEEALRQLDRGHPRAAAGYLTQILDANPGNARARDLHNLIQGAYVRAAGGLGDEPVTWTLFNPNKFLVWVSRTIGGSLFSWVGVVALLAFFALAVSMFDDISFESVSAGPFDITIAVIVFLISQFWHELGHGLVCQHYGGNVTEIGLMLLYVMPAAYCDTTTSYLIHKRRHKVLVQLAGVIATLTFMAGHGMLLALLSPTVPVYSGIMLAFLFTLGFSFTTINPLIKNDGYYALADFLKFPNLRERSFTLLRASVAKLALGVDVKTEELEPRTRRLMISYGLACVVFMCLIIYLALFHMLGRVIERFGGAGVVFAVVVTTLLLRKRFLRTIWQGLRALVRERRHAFTLRRAPYWAIVMALILGPWFVQWRVRVDAPFVIVSAQRADVRAQTTGRVAEIFVAEGTHVRRGQLLARLSNDDLVARIAKLDAEHEAVSHRLAELRSGATAEERGLARARFEHASAELRSATSAASLAARLVKNAIGTQSAADTALGTVAVYAGEVGSAQWAQALIEAGARPEAIASAEAEAASLESQLTTLRTEVQRLTLVSPIDGVVTTPYLDEKLQAKLAPGDLFAEVHDPGAMFAEVSLLPTDPLGTVRVGDEIALRLYAAPHEELVVRVAFIRGATKDEHGEEHIVVVTSQIQLGRPLVGLTGRARIYGEAHSVAYASFDVPMQRLVRVRLWSMF